MKKKLKVIIPIIALVLILIISTFFFLKPKGTYTATDPFYLTAENLPAAFQQSGIFNKLPESASIQINFGGNSYYVEGNKVIKGSAQNPEILIILPESYLNKEWNSVCSLIRSANQNGDLQINSQGSHASLALKYNSLLKYRDCLE